ncbi:MAG TPA: DNA recombination protein RmuC [Stellaceae bacterium]|nr:DNA recombination protein RmuC [Stellaceae bacterium]
MSAEIGIYLSVLVAIANGGLIVCLLWIGKGQRAARDGADLVWRSRFDAMERHNEELRRSFTEMDRALRAAVSAGVTGGLTTAFEKMQEGARLQADGLVHVQNALNQLSETVRHGLDGVSQRLGEGQEQLRRGVEAKLGEIRTSNEAKLEQMRLTVDEKLQATLEQRLGASFRQVSDSLEQVYKSVGEMQSLAVGVGDLKRVLTNIKSRGTWTEIGLETMLCEVLAPDQYGRNVEIRTGSNERVEFAIRLPGDEMAPVWLPIDVKFPTADYERLCLAAERGDQEEADRAARAVEIRVREAARDISTKYINPPDSTDFAVMYLPTEGLFAEVVRRPGLVDGLQREWHIMVAGPTTLFTLLTSMRMGFRSLAIQKRSAEVWKVLGAVKHEFSKFGGVIDKVSRKLDEAQKVIDDEVGRRRRAMERRLRAVEVLPEADAAAVLDDAGDEVLLIDDELDEPLAAQ